MKSFELTIVTPEGSKYEGTADRVTVRTTDGEVSILYGHINYAAALGMGKAEISIGGDVRKACCIGGVLAMTNNVARIVATTFEWADEIDKGRAETALMRAEKALADPNLSPDEKRPFEAARRRAMVRISCASEQ